MIPQRWRIRLVALALGLCTVAVLAIGHTRVGYVRDEGVYFEAGRRYADWVVHVLRDPSALVDRGRRDRAFRFNHEHPALMKTASGLSARLFAEPPVEGPGSGGLWPLLREGTAMRLPAQAVAGLGVAVLFLVGHAWGGVWTGLMAAGWFALLPRVAFHAGLATFDVPVAVASLIVFLVYRRALHDWRWAMALGPILGIAVSIKHNALFLVGILAVHYGACLMWGRWRAGLRLRRPQYMALPLLSMVVLTIPTAIMLWPWLWHDTFARIAAYIEFHRHHAWYNIEYLGQNYNLPPLPLSYPVVMTWATVPTVLLLMAGIGLILGLVGDARAPRTRAARASDWRSPLPDDWPTLDGTLLLVLAVFPLALIALPEVPIFGGTKHWLTAYPFFALAAAVAWARIWSRVEVRSRLAQSAALVFCLFPGAIASLHGHPYNLSQYAPLPGGARGAAALGLNRGFWGHAMLPLRDDMAAATDGTSGRLYLHDLHVLARRQYVREGRWPPRVEPVPLHRANMGLLFHERHMTTYEGRLWDQLETTAPNSVLILDDVPLTSFYRARHRH